MFRCRYCGQHSGIFSRQHRECLDRHERAVDVLPSFFEKFLTSEISTERFISLLHEAAAASFVSSDELRSIIRTGVHRMIDSVLRTRLCSEQEEDRILDLIDKLALPDAEANALDRLMAKPQILRELASGITSDRVYVAGKPPPGLRRSESVIWIFNKSRLRLANPASLGPVPPVRNGYYSHSDFTRDYSVPKSKDARKELVSGDLVLTNYNLRFFSDSSEPDQIPLVRISGVSPYTDAMAISPRAKSRLRILFVDDPWFLANAIAVLHHRLIASR